MLEIHSKICKNYHYTRDTNAFENAVAVYENLIQQKNIPIYTRKIEATFLKTAMSTYLYKKFPNKTLLDIAHKTHCTHHSTVLSRLSQDQAMTSYGDEKYLAIKNELYQKLS